ncbi:MAG: minor capsid protein [Bifidobacteriaceae bacterium]|jgi:hypothetical protein|nr:minor capsid protein [Bifidobacteriaceae bacterium]
MEFTGHFDFDGLAGAGESALTTGLMKAGEHVKEISSRLAPKETGHLAGSADVRLVSQGYVEIRYPGPYARYQEFGVYYRHGRMGNILHHDNGQSFYLTTAMLANRDKVGEIVAQSVRGEI